MLKFIGFVFCCGLSYCIGVYTASVRIAENVATHPELCEQVSREVKRAERHDMMPPPPLKSTSRGYVQD